MILAIDVGNSNIVIGGIDGTKTYFEERVLTDPSKTGLEYAVTIKNILEIHEIDRSEIEGAIVSSVVPPVNPALSSAVKKVLGFHPMLVGPDLDMGLSILTDQPSMVGNDLKVDAVAAIAEFPAPVIVIDMGTATTINVIDRDKNFIGGVILPGVQISLDSLVSRTAQLPSISLDIPGRVIGKNTVDCMRSGIMYGTAAEIDGLISLMEEEIGEKASIVATGGLSRFIVPMCAHDIAYEPDLLLKGLLIIYEKNKAEWDWEK